MNAKNKVIFSLLSLFALTGCTEKKQSEARSNSGSSFSSEESSVTGESKSFVNNKDSFQEETEIDIESDFDSQAKESDDAAEKIDVSSIEKGSSYSITEGGTYLLSGTNEDARVVIDATEDILLELDNLSLTSLTDSPLEVKNAKSITIKALEKTKNYLKDSENNTLEAALIVKKVPLSITGKGYLYVSGKGKSDDVTDSGVGIQAAKGIQIENAHVIVEESVSHARNAKAGLTIKNAKLSLHSKKDGIHTKEGGVDIENSVLNLDTYGDGIDAARDITITSCSIHSITHGEYILYDKSADTDGSLLEDSKYILENGEYKKISSDDRNRYSTRYYLAQKCKGIKTEAKLTVNQGDYYFYTADDSLASDTDIELLSGDFVFYTLDQAINSDQILNIGSTSEEGPSLHIYHSYEGIQGGQISFHSGYAYIESTDDGINATSDTLEDISRNFHDGSTVYVNADGDGIDSNGTITRDGGNLFVFGPKNDGDSSLDSDKGFTYLGGTILAFSQQGRIETPSAENRNVASLNLSSYKEGAVLSFLTNGYEFSALLPKAYSQLNVIIGSDKLVKDNQLEVISVNQTAAEYKNGIYCGEEKGEGTTIATVSLKDGLTSTGNGSTGGPGGFPGGNNGGRPDRP